MSVEVAQTYTNSLNLSITTRNGHVSRVTTWQSGVSGSTEVRLNLPKSRFLRRKS